MPTRHPTTELDPRFSSGDARPTPWQEAEALLAAAELFWLATARPGGQPHVTPLLAVWHDGALYFCTGAEERKARNLAHSPRCTLTTGCNRLGAGLDLVVEGEAQRVGDGATLQRVADQYEAKYGPDWRFTVRDGSFVGEQGNIALVFAVAPAQAFGFGKGPVFSQTRWRFAQERGS